MIIFLYGKDRFRISEALSQMKQKFIRERDPQHMNVIHVDAKKQNAATLWDAMLSHPFLAEKRMIIISHLLETKDKETWKSITTRIEEESLPKDNIYIFVEHAESWRSKDAKTLAGLLQKQPYSKHFEALNGAPLFRWMQQRAAKQHRKINQSACMFLQSSLGNDLWQIDHVIAQASAYAQSQSQQELTQTILSEFVIPALDHNIFALIEGIIEKKKMKVFSLLAVQYEDRDPHYVFMMLIRQFRILAQLTDLQKQNKLDSDTSVGKLIGLHPYAVKQSRRLLKHYGFDRVQAVYDELIHIDRQIKTGQAGQQLLLEYFVGKQFLTQTH